MISEPGLVQFDHLQPDSLLLGRIGLNCSPYL
jgi:hypothetical protein